MATTFKPVFEAAQQGLTADPSTAKAVFEAESRQADGLKSEVRIRQFHLDVDEPEALGGKDQGPNPVEYVLAALASCRRLPTACTPTRWASRSTMSRSGSRGTSTCGGSLPLKRGCAPAIRPLKPRSRSTARPMRTPCAG